jgi:DNA transformation protein
MVMPLDRAYVDYVMELLTPLGGITGRAMFGGYGIFHEGDMFALLSSSSVLYFKADDSNRETYEEVGSEQFMSMPYFEVPVDVLEDSDALQQWARTAIAVGHATARKKRG